MTDLIEWLRAQLDEDESGEWPHRLDCQMHRQMPLPAGHPFAGPMSCNCPVPARWLSEIEAKRRILGEHAHERTGSDAVSVTCRRCGSFGYCTTILLLALPYATREGYREEWRP